MIQRHIIAIGGGALTPENAKLDAYILEQSKKECPKVCFIPTASGDSQDYIDRFYAAYTPLNCKTSHLSLFRGHTAKIEAFILEQDVLIVGGGNTRNLLTLWKNWGVDAFVYQAYQRGAVLAGSSAGSICWFEQGVTDSIPEKLTLLQALGWLKGSNCPHYDTEPNRRPTYHQLLESGEITAGIATEDGVGAHYINETFSKLVTGLPNKKGYWVGVEAGKATKKVITPTHLA